jgi:hypothetical protein
MGTHRIRAARVRRREVSTNHERHESARVALIAGSETLAKRRYPVASKRVGDAIRWRRYPASSIGTFVSGGGSPAPDLEALPARVDPR